MRRVPVMRKYSYLQELYRDYPVLWVDEFNDIDLKLLKDNDHLYQKAQEMDLSPLTLPTFFDNIVSKALNQKYAGQ